MMPDDPEPSPPQGLFTVAQAGYPPLYRYQRFDHGRLRQVICGRLLYFSNPADFNDPWDCRPWFDVSSLTDPDVVERHIAWYQRVTRTHRPDIPEEEIIRRAEAFRADPALLVQKVPEVTAEMERAIQHRYRVFCLGSMADSELMWAHYGARHTGVCLEFTTRNTVFCGALQVQYRDAYPRFDLTADADEENLAPLLTKSAAWSYEGEYRLIAQEKSAAIGSGTLIAEDHLIPMPDAALAAVIVGCLAPDTTVKAVKELIDESGLPIAVRKAVRQRDRYHLTIVDA